MLSGTWDRTPYAMEARILRPLLWFGLLEHRSEKTATDSASSTSKFSEARLYDFIHKQQGVRFGPFRLDLEQRPPRGLCARKELKLAPLSLLETEQAQPSAADSP